MNGDARPTPSPFLLSIVCPSDCPDHKLQNHCSWNEAFFDCINDFNQNHGGGFHMTTDDPDVARPRGTTSADAYFENDHDAGYGGHAALHYCDVEEAGPPARPQEFPTPFLHEGTRATIQAMDHRTKSVREVKNVLLAMSNIDGLKYPAATMDKNIVNRAYLLKKRISKSSDGNRYLSVVLQRRNTGRASSFDRENEKSPEDELDGVEWESTEEFVTITVSPWNEAMRRHRRSLSQKREGPVHAIAAMQHLGSYHPHVMGLLAVFSDELHLYTVTPYHGGMHLQTKIVSSREQGQYTPNEPQARMIFTQLLQGLFHLQRKGVCHSNLSLENIYIDRHNQNLVIAELGRSFRVPYNDPSNFGCLTGETEGTTRRLLQLLPQDFSTHPPENLMYLSPEIVENEEAFDGFAADLWAAACVLFVLLVGMAPFKTAHYWDAAYAEISSGNLKGLLFSLNIQLSEEATGLLQNMFWRDPRDRLTLAQIMDHAWVKNQQGLHRTSVVASGTFLPGDMITSRLSNADTDTASSSSVATDKSEKGRGSRSAISKALTMLGVGSTEKSESRDNSGSKGWGGLLPPSRRSSKTRRTSLGGLSSAASSVTASSPKSPKLGKAPGAGKQDALGFQVLQLLSL